LLSDPYVIHCALTSYPNEPIDIRVKKPKRWDFELRGTLQNGKFNGGLDIDFLRRTKTKLREQKIETIFKNINFSFTEEEQLKLFIQQADISYTSGSNEHTLLLDDFSALLNIQDTRFKFLKFNSKIYDGILGGGGYFDISTFPIKCISRFTIRKVSANKLDSLVEYFSKVFGKFTSNICYKTYPKSNLDGTMVISDGYLKDFEFFQWLADYFALPNLKKVNFDRLTTSFLVNDDVARLDRINLYSPETTLRGYFGIYENDLVSSRLLISLSRNILGTSPKFKSLLRLLGEDFTSLNFDFQLSGLFEKMNFKWQDTYFKKRLKKAVPGFIERGIERKVEREIKSIAVEN